MTKQGGNRQAFSGAEYDARVRRIQEDMVAPDLGVLLVHTPENIYYLTRYETSGYFEYHAHRPVRQGLHRLHRDAIERTREASRGPRRGVHEESDQQSLLHQGFCATAMDFGFRSAGTLIPPK